MTGAKRRASRNEVEVRTRVLALEQAIGEEASRACRIDPIIRMTFASQAILADQEESFSRSGQLRW
jgi:hypothetical protein